MFRETWPGVEVHLTAGEVIRVDRPYGLVDREALRESLLQGSRSATFLCGAVVATESDRAGTVLRDDRGRTHRARIFADCTGAQGASAYQTAHGLFAEVEGLEGSEPRWMDFSMEGGDGLDQPSFLYALPLRSGAWLLEETALVARPSFPHGRLEERLSRRLEAMGVRVKRALGTERCTIPMDTLLQSQSLPVRFGSAAGMVHPATGYLLPRVLASAPRLADVFLSSLSEGEQGLEALSAKIEGALWPAGRRRRYHLYRYGGSVLTRLDLGDTRSFFRAFFSMPASFVAGYLDDSLTTSELVYGMSALFYRLPAHLRLKLLAKGSPSELWSAALPNLETFA